MVSPSTFFASVSRQEDSIAAPLPPTTPLLSVLAMVVRWPPNTFPAHKGDAGLGKTTLVESLFKQTLEEEANAVPGAPTGLEILQKDLQEGGVNLKLTIASAVDLGEALDRTDSAKPALGYINAQFESYLQVRPRPLPTSHPAASHHPLRNGCLSFYRPSRFHPPGHLGLPFSRRS